MAQTVTQTTASITRVQEIFLNAILAAKVFDPSSGIRQVQGTRDKFSMVELFTNTNIVQPYADKPAESGDGALTDIEFDIAKKSINYPVPYDLFKNTQWKEAIQNIHAMGLPQEVQVAIVESITKKALAEIENEIVSGNAGATGDKSGGIDGFIKVINDKLTAASLTAQIIAADTSLTNPALIQGVFTNMVNQVPTPLLTESGAAKLIVSPATDWAYKRSLQLQANAVSNSGTENFGGFELMVIPNMNPRWAAIGNPSNIGIGTPSAISDIVSLQVNDMSHINQNQANIFGNFGFGVGAVTTDWVTFENTTA